MPSKEDIKTKNENDPYPIEEVNYDITVDLLDRINEHTKSIELRAKVLEARKNVLSELPKFMKKLENKIDKISGKI